MRNRMNGAWSTPAKLRSGVLGLLFVASVVSAGCSEDGTQPRAGRYVGDQVSFQLSGTTLSDIRLSGIECRVPHPDNPVLALCLERAPGIVTDSIQILDGAFAANLGDVELTGTFDGAGTASGTWRFETNCGVTESPCIADGTWTATWRAPVVSDTGGADTDAADVPMGTDTPDGTDTLGPLDTGTDSPLGPPAPEQASAAQKLAQTLLSDRRQRAGVGPITMDSALNDAAQDHADYYSVHASKYQSAGLSPHRQNSQWSEGFTGVTLSERLAAAGASGGGASEVMAFSFTTEGAIDGWMDTLYHRVPLIHPNADRWGYGESVDGAQCQVGDIVFGPTQGAVARWPAPSAVGVARSWNGFESPQPPLPSGASYPSGPVVTVTYGQSLGALTEATLTHKATGEQVALMHRDPVDDSWLSTTWALYALDPLAPSSTYVVRFVGGAIVETWEFTTGP